MGDDHQKNKERTGRNKPTDHSGVAPTRAFRQQPTEVLDLPAPDPKKLVDPNAATRRTSMQNKVLVDDEPDGIPSEFFLDDEPSAPPPAHERAGEFEDPHGTEVLGAFEPDAGPQGLRANVTEPEPFRPPALNSDMRALHEVAREPTAVHEVIDGSDSDPEGTDTSVDAEDSSLFEEPTDGYHKEVTGESDSPFSEHVHTAEEEAPGHEPAAPAPSGLPSAPHTDAPSNNYYADVQKAFNSARVYDPKTAANAVLDDDAFAPRASADWPEISLEGPPAEPPGGAGRSPLLLAGLFAGILIVTIGGMGAAFKLGLVGGGGADEGDKIWRDPPAEPAPSGAAPADRENDPTAGAGEGAPEEAPAPTEPTEPTEQPSRDESWKAALKEAAAPALAGVDGAWAKRALRVRLARATDTSKSGFAELDDDLALAFGTILTEDDHARWRLRNRVRRGLEVELELTQLQIASGTAETVVRARCTARAEGKRMKPKKLQREVEVEQRIESPTPGAPTAEIARDIAKACGYRLAWDFIASVLE